MCQPKPTSSATPVTSAVLPEKSNGIMEEPRPKGILAHVAPNPGPGKPRNLTAPPATGSLGGRRPRIPMPSAPAALLLLAALAGAATEPADEPGAPSAPPEDPWVAVSVPGLLGQTGLLHVHSA